MSDTHDYEQPEDEEGFDPNDIHEEEDDDNTAPPEGDDEDDDLEIGFDGEAVQETDPMRQLRERNRLQTEEIRQLRSRVPDEKPIDPGPKPTLENCEFDETRFETELDAWKDKDRERLAQAERAQADSRQTAQVIEADVQSGLERFEAFKKALKVPNFDLAQSTVAAALDPTQQLCLIQACDGDSAKMIYALGRTPAKLAEIAAIKNPARFSAAVARMEGKITVKSRRQAPEPDEPVRGAGRITNGGDKTEKRLMEEAEASGDSSKLVKYRYDKKQAAKAKR